MLLPKPKTPRSKPYMAFIRTKPCLLHRRNHGPCFGDVIPHHTETGGTSLKGSDFSCVPLCCAHHAVMDNAGKKGRGVWKEEELAGIIQCLQREWAEKGGRLPSP